MAAITGIFKTHSDFIRALLWALLPAAGFASALFYTSLDEPDIGLIVLPVMLFGLCVAFIPAVCNKTISVPWNGLSLSIALYAAYLCITILWSPVPYSSLLFLHIFLLLPFMYFSVLSAPNPRHTAYAYISLIGVAMFCLAMWVFVQFFFLFATYGPRIHHPFLNPNDLGALLGLGVMLSAALYMQSASKKRMLIALAMALVFVTAVFMTQGRAILLALTLCYALLVFLMRKNTDVLKFKAPILFLLIFIIYAALDIRVGSRISQSLDQIVSEGVTNVSVDSRILLWDSTLHIIKDHPWLGVGLGNFHYLYPRYRSPRDSSDGFFTHMDPMQFWAECGVLLPILFYAMLVMILLRTIKVLRVAPPNSRPRAIVAGTFCGLLALLMHTHLSFDLYQPSLLLAISACFLLWYVEGESVLAPQRKAFLIDKKPAHLALCGLFIVAFSCSAMWMARTALALVFIQDVVKVSDSGDIEGARKELKKVQFWAPDAYPLQYEYQGRLATAALEKVSDNDPMRKKELYDEAIASFAESRARDPYDSYGRFFQAVAYERGYERHIDPKGREIAKQLMAEVLKDDPLLMEARLGLASMYGQEGNDYEAIKVLEDGMEWPKPMRPIAIDYFMKLANYYKGLGNTKGYDFLFHEAEVWNGRLELLKGKK